MDPSNALPLIEDLEANIDELTAILTPLLPPTPLSNTLLPLPLLSKAKLHTLLAYAIESTLFNSLVLTGADAKAHPIYAELARLRGYFAKTKVAEEHTERLAQKEGRARLDVAAAGRFIKHGLSGNERFDELRRERERAEKERGLARARALVNKKFEEGGEVKGMKRGVEEEGATPTKRVRVEEDREEEDEGEVEGGEEVASPAPSKRGRPSKKDRLAAATAQNDTPPRATRSTAPKTRSEAFQALAGSPAGGSKPKGKGKAKGKGKDKAT
ncbi:hypothetical protein C7974DRAFT_398437 [Boeremia exigua]|uniref:uncharacterized protein n=1 Tax=Boeremia exigua TaxID=749465 RepID=UPI001E8D37F5|nr:uncharacterized protein C7974DRAFT_398437 [Boeremia exigua]KAH6619903.1 hypothetical protein C7974DRAFT_398437 [Boeremia exigua]